MLKKLWLLLSFVLGGVLFSSTAPAQANTCGIAPNVYNGVFSAFAKAAQVGGHGLFSPYEMWAAVVDRDGRLCDVRRNSTDAWPGSRAIAIAKASTANDFSNSHLAFSTAGLYAATQPGGFLFGLNNSNPYNAVFNEFPAQGHIPGGIITFGGGVALYYQGKVIGGFGVSGDTSCADHFVAYSARAIAIKGGLLSPVPGPSDNIVYLPAPGGHPHCLADDGTP